MKLDQETRTLDLLHGWETVSKDSRPTLTLQRGYAILSGTVRATRDHGSLSAFARLPHTGPLTGALVWPQQAQRFPYPPSIRSAVARVMTGQTGAIEVLASGEVIVSGLPVTRGLVLTLDGVSWKPPAPEDPFAVHLAKLTLEARGGRDLLLAEAAALIKAAPSPLGTPAERKFAAEAMNWLDRYDAAFPAPTATERARKLLEQLEARKTSRGVYTTLERELEAVLRDLLTEGYSRSEDGNQA